MNPTERANNRIRTVCCIVLILCSFFVFGQEELLPPDLWYNGEVLLPDSSSVVGKLKYDFQGSSVLLKSKGEVKAYSPKTFIKVDFSDSTGKERMFVVRNLKNKKGFQVALFFEVLFKGATTLFVREEVVYYSSGNMATQGFQSEIKRLLVYRYYFQKGEGTLYYFRPTKSQVLRILKSKKEQIKLFVKDNKFRYSSKNDLIAIFIYYNTLL
jgi:hypothetical protein